MLKSIFSTIIFTLFTLIAFCQDPDCSAYRDGKFKISDPDAGGTTIIERKGNYQIETQESQGVRMRFKVDWLDNCSYTLQLDKVFQNDQNLPFNKEMIITVKIIEVYKDAYLQESTSNLYPTLKYTSKVVALR